MAREAASWYFQAFKWIGFFCIPVIRYGGSLKSLGVYLLRRLTSNSYVTYHIWCQFLYELLVSNRRLLQAHFQNSFYTPIFGEFITKLSIGCILLFIYTVISWHTFDICSSGRPYHCVNPHQSILLCFALFAGILQSQFLCGPVPHMALHMPTLRAPLLGGLQLVLAAINCLTLGCIVGFIWDSHCSIHTSMHSGWNGIGLW